MLKLSIVWWLVMGGLGLIFPFLSLYLSENAALSGTQVGLVMATPPLIGLVAQPFWGQLADRSGQRARVLSLLALGTAAGYGGLALAPGFVGYLVCIACLAFFSTALIPTCVSVSLAALPGQSATGFGRVRVMGTLGFAASVGLFPLLLGWLAAERDTRTSGAGEPWLGLVFPLAAAHLLLAAVVSRTLPRGGAMAVRAAPGEWRLLLRNRRFLRVLVFTFLAYLSIQGPMVLFPILVRAQGGGMKAISQMWLIMLALEVPLVFYFGASVARIGARGVIAIGIGAAALRWGVSGFATDLAWMHAAQLLHGVTVWGIILGIPMYVDAIVPERLRSTAQGLLAMIGISLGSILSNAGAGWITEAVGPKAPAQIAGIAALALTLALPLLVPRPGEGSGRR